MSVRHVTFRWEVCLWNQLPSPFNRVQRWTMLVIEE